MGLFGAIQRTIAMGSALVLVQSETACATLSSEMATTPEVRQLSYAQRAVVVGVRPVWVSEVTPAGMVAGSLIGFILLAQEGPGHRCGFRSGLLTDGRQILGTTAGAAIGHGVAWALGKEWGEEVIIQLGGGRRAAVVQGKRDQKVAPGGAVAIVDVDRRACVVKLDGGK